MLKTKCQRILNIFRVLAHTAWGADRQIHVLLRVHKALILSKLLYGCEVYSSATPRRLKMLYSVHHAGIKLATGAFRTSPISSLLVDAGELPLQLHCQSSILRYWYRMQRFPSSLASQIITSKRHFRHYEMHLKCPQPYVYKVKQLLGTTDISRDEVLPYKMSVIPLWKLTEISFCKYFNGFKKNMTDIDIRSIFMEHSEVHKDSIRVITDGSKSSAGAGFGVFSNKLCTKDALPVLTSIFAAELLGILNAIEKIAIIDETKFTIFSDCF
ncbi:uncharacterized protein [Macrobrachium rosenbergii]|uniref:uncharacterized protein n=1 Tax=Macrobrachium rosenbergii TaxID=79674 RepID=UPI0034D65F1A